MEMQRHFHRLAVAALATLPGLGYGQNAGQTPATPVASCGQQLTWAENFASRNYAGYEDKVTAAARPAYDSLMAALLKDASVASTDAACDVVLRRWVAFFHDRHLGIGRRMPEPAVTQASTPPDSPDAIRARYAGWERLPIDEAGARSRLQASEARDPLEGIWRSSDGAYRVAVLRDSGGRDLVMTVLRADSVYWVPGQVKAAFTRAAGGAYATRFYMRDHSEQSWTARVQRNLLRFSSGSIWIREWPERPDDLTPTERRTTEGRFAAYDIAPGTVVVRVPTFNDPEGIDSLFAAEGNRIRSADRLIIDVRGNGGGSDYNYRELAPLLYTNPTRSIGVDFLASDENIAAQMTMASDTTYPAGQRRQLQWSADRMAGSRGGWLRGSDETRSEPRVLDTPRVVAVIVDQGCASSCEQFLLMARQSTKVTLYGDRSGGILDYGNVRAANMPGGTLVLSRPISRTRRLPKDPIDNIGIAPDVRVPDDVLLPVLWVVERMKK